MPPKKGAAALDSVYVITLSHLDAISKEYDKVELLEIHSSLDSANAAAEDLATTTLTDTYKDPVSSQGENSEGGFTFHCTDKDDPKSGFDLNVAKYDVKSGGAPKKATKEKVATASPAKAKCKVAKAPEPEDDDDDDEGEQMEDAEVQAPRPKRKATAKAPAKTDDKDSKIQIPEGKPNSLKGLKLLFTGTFELDRKTCEATAITYGAKLVKKLQDTDFIILGTRPGQKKVDEISEHGLKTIDIDEFHALLKTGKHDGKAEEAGGKEPAKKKQKK